MTELDSECCRPSLKSTGEDKEETEQVTGSRAAANEISADAAVAAVLSQLLCICTLKEGEIMALQAFRRGTVLFLFFCFCQDFSRGIKTNHSSPQGGDGHP